VTDAKADRPTPEVLVKLFDPTEVVLALEVRSREYRDSALLFERAACELRAAAAQTAAHDKQLRTLEDRIESLSTDLQNTKEELKAKTGQVRDQDASIQNLNQSASELSSRLAKADAATSQLRTGIDAAAASHKQEMELLVQRMEGQTNQQLEEFRNDVGRRVSEVLRGTPPLDSVGSVIDGKAILVRVWEIIEALKRKSIPIRLG
jgi:chromosome segregation ATPase